MRITNNMISQYLEFYPDCDSPDIEYDIKCSIELGFIVISGNSLILIDK